LLTKSLEVEAFAFGIPALKSSSGRVDLGGTTGPGPEEGEVESRSTRFLGKMPSFAASVSIALHVRKEGDLPGSIFPVVGLSGLPTPGLLLPPICWPDRLLWAGTGSSDMSTSGHGQVQWAR